MYRVKSCLHRWIACPLVFFVFYLLGAPIPGWGAVLRVDFMGRAGASASGWQTIGDGTSGGMTGAFVLLWPDGTPSDVTMRLEGAWTRVASDGNQGAFAGTEWDRVANDFLAAGSFSTEPGWLHLTGLDPATTYRVEICSVDKSEGGVAVADWTVQGRFAESEPSGEAFDAHRDGFREGRIMRWDAVRSDAGGALVIRAETTSNRRIGNLNALRITDLSSPLEARTPPPRTEEPVERPRPTARRQSQPAEPTPRPAGAVTLFLSPDGDEEALERAFRDLRAGDTLVFRQGIHRIGRVQIRDWALVGSEEQPITIRGEDGAVLEGRFDRATNQAPHGPDESSGISVGGGRSQWVIVENLVMRRNATISVGNRNITYRNCRFEDYSNYGLIVNGMRGLRVEDCVFQGSAYEHGIYLTVSNHDVVIRNNRFTDTAINGLHINGPDNRRIVVENNIFHGNSRSWGACITLMGAREVVIRNNLFYANLGHMITLTQGKLADGEPRAIEIVHNTFYQPEGGRNGQVMVVRAPLLGVRFRNNIVHTNNRAFDFEGDCLTDTTVFEGNVYGPACGRQMESLGQERQGVFDAAVRFGAAPGWADRNADLRLRPGSAGTTGAPLLESAPLDIRGEPRRDGGPAGAFAGLAE